MPSTSCSLTARPRAGRTRVWRESDRRSTPITEEVTVFAGIKPPFDCEALLRLTKGFARIPWPVGKASAAEQLPAGEDSDDLSDRAGRRNFRDPLCWLGVVG